MWINCDDGDFLYVDCIRVSIPAVTLSIGLRDVSAGEPGKGYSWLFCFISYNCM